MKRNEWRCQANGDHAGDLNVHHRYYATCEPWNELDENLIVLCEKHHQGEHDLLGSAANEVAEALKHSNWMVQHRRLLTQCIDEKLFSPEELSAFVKNRQKKVP
jgi:hypothetical protein